MLEKKRHAMPPQHGWCVMCQFFHPVMYVCACVFVPVVAPAAPCPRPGAAPPRSTATEPVELILFVLAYHQLRPLLCRVFVSPAFLRFQERNHAIACLILGGISAVLPLYDIGQVSDGPFGEV